MSLLSGRDHDRRSGIKPPFMMLLLWAHLIFSVCTQLYKTYKIEA